MQPCPDCEGKGQVTSFACPGFRWMDTPCRLCGGTGQVSEEALAAVANGAAFRAYRVGIYLSQRQMAEVHKVTPADLSRMEHGILPLTESMQKELSQHRVAGAVLNALYEAKKQP